jgi:DNA-binding NarL/FixJ family response regulator
MENTTICIIDDHKIVRQGLKELLEKISNYKVIYEFDSGETFLESLPLEIEPHLYILDYSMPVLNGIEVLKILAQKEALQLKVLMLTQHFDEMIINAAYHYGARGFLHKNCTAQELKFAIDNIVTIGYTNVTEILKRARSFDVNMDIKQFEKIILTPRELQFIALVCSDQELTYEHMAEIMKVSLKSIEVYRAGIFERFHIKSKVGLVLFSYKYKLTEPFL